MLLDLAAYAARIEYRGALLPTLGTLKDLHLAHTTHIPFENLDVLLGRPIRLDIETLWKKLVDGGRGGYCFEHNTLFAAVLETIGFRVERLAARVRLGATRVLPRTHMLLVVQVNGAEWLADVGFGGDGLLLPVPLQPGEEVSQFGWKHRVIVEDAAFVLQTALPEGWADMYCFTREPQQPVDYDLANYYISTHPESPFVRSLTAQLPGPHRRLILRDRQLAERAPECISETTLPDDDAVLEVLSRCFHLNFPAGTRFPREGSPVSVQAVRDPRW